MEMQSAESWNTLVQHSSGRFFLPSLWSRRAEVGSYKTHSDWRKAQPRLTGIIPAEREPQKRVDHHQLRKSGFEHDFTLLLCYCEWRTVQCGKTVRTIYDNAHGRCRNTYFSGCYVCADPNIRVKIHLSHSSQVWLRGTRYGSTKHTTLSSTTMT